MKFTKVKQDEVRYGAINFQENDVVIVQLNDYAERDEVDAVGQAFRTAISERGLKKVTLIITQGHMDVEKLSDYEKRRIYDTLKLQFKG